MSIPEFVRGPIANVFTIFDSAGELDAAGQCAFLDFLGQSGAISAYFVRSGMGQMYSFSYDDTRRMAETACNHLRGKAPVLVGATGIWDHNWDRMPDPARFLREAEDLTRYAEDVGAAGTVHTMPEAIQPGPGESERDVTLRYFEAIDKAATKPVFVYQPPKTTKAYCVTYDLVRELADLPMLTGIKLSTPDAGYILDINHALRDKDFAFITGVEMAFYAGLCCGARAVIGQGCCINPLILRAVQDRFEAGDYEGAMDAQRSVNMLCEKSVAPVEFLKRYAAEQGFKVGPFGRPTVGNPYFDDPAPLSAEAYETFKALLEAELARYAS